MEDVADARIKIESNPVSLFPGTLVDPSMVVGVFTK